MAKVTGSNPVEPTPILVVAYEISVPDGSAPTWHEPFCRLPREFDSSSVLPRAMSAYQCHDEHGASEFGFVEDLYPIGHELEQSVRVQSCGLPPFRGCHVSHPPGEGREPRSIGHLGSVRLTISGPVAGAKELNSPPGIFPPLIGIEDGHRHGWVGQQVPAVQRSRVRQEV